VRGTPPTDVETWFFVSDDDGEKRAKVVDWMTDDETAKLIIAKKLGVAPDRVKVVRARLSADGRLVEVQLEPAGDVIVKSAAALSPDGEPAAQGELAFRVKLTENSDAGAAGRLRERGAVDRLVVKNWITNGQQKGAPAADVTAVWERVLVANDPPAKGATDPRLHIVTLTNEENFEVVLHDVLTGLDANTDSDAEFLKRVLTDVRGSGPTALETKYFTEDKDPKKREKLLDALLKDAAVQKKLGDAWKTKMLALKPTTIRITGATNDRIIRWTPEVKVQDVVVPRTITAQPLPPQPPRPPVPPQPPVVVKPFTVPLPPPPPAAPQADRLEKLVGELIAAKKSDEAILEALTLATLGRLPTDSEKKLTTAGVSTAADRKTAWVAVARALAGTDKPTTTKFKVVAPVPPVPPAPPVPPVPPVKP
jgi:hypothetical protein